MNILIWTFAKSYQCAALKYVLDQEGIGVDLISSSDIPLKTTLSFTVGQSAKSNGVKCNSPLLKIKNSAYDTVINYRFFKPVLPKVVDQQTLNYLSKINERVLKSLQLKMAKNSFQVNSLEAKERCVSKALQLTTASEVGLIIPETIISNDAEEVLKFAKPYGRIVAKGLFPAVWETQSNKQFSGQIISVLSYDDIQKNRGGLQVSPMIFQPYIEKAYELRVVVMGASIFAFKINSQINKSTTLDWRNIKSPSDLSVEVANLPDKVEVKILDFMIKMGLVFGSLDLIVTPNNDIVFLEVNEFGQYLWIENLLPEAFLFDAFCEFIKSQNPNFEYAVHKHQKKYNDIYNDPNFGSFTDDLYRGVTEPEESAFINEKQAP